MNKKEEVNKDLKKPDPLAFKNWTELIKPTKIDVNKEEDKKKREKLSAWLTLQHQKSLFCMWASFYWL